MKTKYFDLPFDEGKARLKAKGFEIPYAHVNAELRIQRGYENLVSTTGNWVREGPLYLRGDNTRLLRTALPYLHPKEATDSHRQGNEYAEFSEDELEQARAQSLEVKKEDLDKDGNVVIPCSSIDSNKFGLWFFGGIKGTDSEKTKKAQDYGDWLLNSPQKINEILVYLDKQDYTEKIGNHANQFRFRGLDYRSELGGNNRNLYFSSRVRGVCDVTGEASSQKIKQLSHKETRKYSRQQQYLNILQGVREGRLPVSKLDKLISDFQDLN